MTSTMDAVAAKKHTITTEGETGARIGPASLVTARWALIAVAVGLVVVQLWRPGYWGGDSLGSPWAPFGVIGLWAAGNWYAARSARQGAPSKKLRADAGVHLLMDVTLLTVLLAFTGGANNPFTMLYFLPITLATLVSRSWTWLVALAAVVGFAALVGVSTWLMAATQSHHAAHVGHHHVVVSEEEGHFWRHLVGMGVALAVAGSLVTYFVHKLAGMLTAQREELERLRREAREDRYVASLGALSAGAAHELGTPLGTIQLLVGELEWMGEQERRDAAELIRAELERCKGILHGMKNPELSAQALEAEAAWSMEQLAQGLRGLEVPPDAELTIRVAPDASGDWYQPRAVLEQTLREFVLNAFRARDDARPLRVDVSLARAGDVLVATVSDTGRGMNQDELAFAFTPFFSTRDGGRGLGLFLARLHARQLGGTLELQSQLGGGTTVVLSLPRHPPRGIE